MIEYERQVIQDMIVKVVSSLAAKWDNIMKGVEDITGGAILDLAEGAKRANMTQEEFARKVNDA